VSAGEWVGSELPIELKQPNTLAITPASGSGGCALSISCRHLSSSSTPCVGDGFDGAFCCGGPVGGIDCDAGGADSGCGSEDTSIALKQFISSLMGASPEVDGALLVQSRYASSSLMVGVEDRTGARCG